MVGDPATSGHVELDTLLSGSEAPLDPPVSLDDVAMIMYTSGTTGHPKDVALTHGNLAWNTFNVLMDVDVSADDVTLISAPLFHTAALNHTFLPTFVKGGTCVLVPAFDPVETLQLIAEHRVTWMFGVPSMFQALVRAEGWKTADLSSVRAVEAGGAPVPEELIRTYQARGLTFMQGYGMTEAEVMGDGWFHTGDAGGMDDEGYFFIVDRIKDMFISGGENVYPAEVENAIYEHPAVAEVAVIGVSDEQWGEVGRAFVVLREGHDLDHVELTRFLDSRIARYKMPKSVVPVGALPRNASGKLLKRSLPTG